MADYSSDLTRMVSANPEELFGFGNRGIIKFREQTLRPAIGGTLSQTKSLYGKHMARTASEGAVVILRSQIPQAQTEKTFDIQRRVLKVSVPWQPDLQNRAPIGTMNR